MAEWRDSTWGEEVTLEYGKALRDYSEAAGAVRVYGTNGPIGWTDTPLAPGPGVILGRKGAYRGVHFSPDPFFVIDTAYYVAPKTELDMRWLYYAIIHYQLGQIDDGSPIPSTTRAAVYPREIAVPRPHEQRAIAAVLGAMDDKIEQNRRTARALERLARAIFRAWFVDFEPFKAKAAGATAFPSMPQRVFDALPIRFVDSAIGPVPEGWTLKSLYDTAVFVNGAAFRKAHFCKPTDGFPVVKIAELKNGITEQTKFSNRQDLDPKYRINTGEMLYSWSGSPDTSLDTFLWTKGPAFLNQHIFRILTENNAQRYVVYYLLKHLRQTLVAIARDKQTTGLGHVTVADMRRLIVCWPNKDVLDGFELQVGPVFEGAFALLIENERLAAMRDYLLPKLLSGLVRVKAAP